MPGDLRPLLVLVISRLQGPPRFTHLHMHADANMHTCKHVHTHTCSGHECPRATYNLPIETRHQPQGSNGWSTLMPRIIPATQRCTTRRSSHSTRTRATARVYICCCSTRSACKCCSITAVRQPKILARSGLATLTTCRCQRPRACPPRQNGHA